MTEETKPTKAWLIPFAVAAGLVAAVIGVNVGDDFDPGPIPTCDGEQATHVLVASGTSGDYAAWADAGVDIQEPRGTDAGLHGTRGHDVLVALISTETSGIFGSPSWQKPPSKGGALAGDTVCGGPGDNIYYLGRFADRIIDGNGSADINTGGCSAETSTEPSEHNPDFLVCDEVNAGAGVDFIWGFIVPKGRHQHLAGGADQDHIYAGRGKGQIEAVGGTPTRDICPPHHLCTPGDHVHPCPNGSIGPQNITTDTASFQNRGILTDRIEYIGTEAALGNPDGFDPCAIWAKNL